MKYLLDANVISELMKPAPVERVVQWMRSHESQAAVNPIILGEVWYGIHVLPEGARRKKLEQWFWSGVSAIACTPWDGGTGLRWGALLVELRKRGLAMPLKDSMIAATALEHGLSVVTRNVRDFLKAGVKVVNPFEE